jgi:exosortase/archaeosortase family protein
MKPRANHGGQASVPARVALRRGGAGESTTGRQPGGRAVSNGRVFGFVLRFCVFWALALAIVSQAPVVEQWAVDATLASLVLTLRLASVEVVLMGNLLHAANTGIEIVPDCTPLMPTLVFWAAVAAFPVPWRRRVPGLLVGGAAIWVFNLVRVLALFGVLVWMPQHFKFVHVYLWQTGTLLVVCALFVLWVRLQSARA